MASSSASCRRGLLFAAVAALVVAASGAAAEESESMTAVDLAGQVFAECLQRGSLACLKPRVQAFLAEQRPDRAIRITRDLAIVPVSSNAIDDNGAQDSQLDADDVPDRKDATRHLLLERVDAIERFLRGHEVRVAVPRELSEAVPRAVRDALPAELRLPLDPDSEDPDAVQARHHRRRKSFLKKVVLPFILGLKFKTTALIPLALSLIALKTWKALTLGLLSLVLSGAMVIFRFTKPKVVNYDVYHYPQPHAHYEHVDHHPSYDHAHYDHYDHHTYAAAARAYSAHQP